MKKNINYKIKKVLSIMLLAVLVFFLTGCAQGMYQFNLYKDGRISESFYVSLNKNAIEIAGYDYQEVEGIIFGQFMAVTNHLTNNFTNNLEVSPLQKNRILQGIRQPTLENGLIGVTFWFGSPSDFRLFYGVEEPGEPVVDNKIIEDKGFFIKTTTKTNTAFKGGQTSSFASSLLEYFDGEEEGTLVFDFSDIRFSYSYGTYSSKLRSNSDKTYYTASGLKVHEWFVPSDNYDLEIEFYEYQIVAVWWYVLALVMTGLFLVGLLIAHYIKVFIKSKQTAKNITLDTGHINKKEHTSEEPFLIEDIYKD